MLKCYENIKAGTLLDKSVLFGKTAGILMVVSGNKKNLSTEDHRVLELVADYLKKIIGNMKFVINKGCDLDSEFPPTYKDELVNYITHCAYEYLAKGLRLKGIIINSACWMEFVPILNTIKAIRSGDFEKIKKADTERGIEFFQHLKERFWEEGQGRVNAEIRREDTD